MVHLNLNLIRCWSRIHLLMLIFLLLHSYGLSRSLNQSVIELSDQASVESFNIFHDILSLSPCCSLVNKRRNFVTYDENNPIYQWLVRQICRWIIILPIFSSFWRFFRPQSICFSSSSTSDSSIQFVMDKRATLLVLSIERKRETEKNYLRHVQRGKCSSSLFFSLSSVHV